MWNTQRIPASTQFFAVAKLFSAFCSRVCGCPGVEVMMICGRSLWSAETCLTAGVASWYYRAYRAGSLHSHGHVRVYGCGEKNYVFS